MNTIKILSKTRFNLIKKYISATLYNLMRHDPQNNILRVVSKKK